MFAKIKDKVVGWFIRVTDGLVISLCLFILLIWFLWLRSCEVPSGIITYQVSNLFISFACPTGGMS